MPDESRVSDFTLGSGEFRRAKPKAQAPEAGLAEFYKEKSSLDLPALVRQSRRHRMWLYLTSALAVLLILALLGFFAFNRTGNKFGEESVSLLFQGPASAPSGQVVEYTLSYTNDQGVKLNNLEADLRYPDGFTFQTASVQPTASDGKHFSLGDLGAKQSAQLTIRGQLVGEVGEHKEVMALLAYEPENFRAQFTKGASTSTEIIASVLNLDVKVPAQLPIDQSLKLAVSYRNSSANALSGLVVRLTLPSGFQLDVPELEVFGGSVNSWKLPNLEPKSEGEREFVGRFTSTAQAGTQEFKVAIGIASDDGKTITVQEEKSVSLNLVKSHLTLNLTANEVSLKSTATLGEEVIYEVSLANEGEITFSDLRVEARLDTAYLDWPTLRDDSGGLIDSSRGTIVWTKSALPILESLGPGSRGTIRWRVKLNPTLPAGIVEAPQFKARVIVEGKAAVGDKQETISSESNEVVTKVNTRFSLNSEGRYYTNDLVKLGSGPLPPQVGQTTTYVIFWSLSTSINEAENVEVTTTLPAEVTWTGQTTVTAGQRVTYNPNTREVRWQLNRLPVSVRPEASFEVAITPQAADADKILVLIKASTATARDSFSGADLIATAKLVTTELDEDLAAQGKGVVVR